MDVNYYGNTIVIKYEDGTVRLLNGAEVRRGTDETTMPGRWTHVPVVLQRND